MSHALPAFSGYGIELEYAIVDRDTLSVMPVAEEFLRKLSAAYTSTVSVGASAVSIGEVGWSNELVQHQIELKNIKPHASIESLLPAFQAEIERANQILESMGAKLMPAGMHPWMNPLAETNIWRGDNSEIYNAYDRIFGCRSHGWANLQSLHLNLPFGDDIQFERLHAAIRILLPILPALAASSPIADGVYSGFLDFRMKNYCGHQMKFPVTMGRVIPDTATSPSAYTDEILSQMYREVAESDPEGILQYEWLNARGVIPRFDRNALEIRVIDSQECLQADLAIAAAVTSIVHAFYDEVYATLEEQQAIGTDVLAEVLESCIRDGELAIVDNAEYLRLMGFPSRHCEARELWRNLTVVMHRSQVEQSQNVEKALDTILKQGPLARRILRALGSNWQEAQLHAVYEELCACLEEGRMFLGLKQLPQRQGESLSRRDES